MSTSNNSTDEGFLALTRILFLYGMFEFPKKFDEIFSEKIKMLFTSIKSWVLCLNFYFAIHNMGTEFVGNMGVTQLHSFWQKSSAKGFFTHRHFGPVYGR